MLRQRLHDLYRNLEISTHQLRYLFLEITRTCDLHCLHCGSDCSANDRTPTLTRESWLSIIDDVCGRFPGDLLFVITGGEPLTSPFLLDIGTRTRNRGRSWGMVTNGMRLDEKTLGRLEQAGLASLTISLDGGKEAHDFLRGSPGAYDRALRATGLAAASGVRFVDVVTCVYPRNLEALASIAETLIDRGIRYWRLFRLFPRGRAAENPTLFLDGEQNRRLWQWIAENRPAYRARGLNLNYSCEGWFSFSFDRKLRAEPFFCRAGVSIASVLCDGTITGCPNNGAAFVEGNVATNDFAEVWENGFGKFRDRAWMRKGLCGACEHFAHCRGGSVHLWDDEGSSPLFCPMRG